MKCRFAFVYLALVVILSLLFTACGDSEYYVGRHNGSVQGSENEDGYSFAVSGSIPLFNSLVPVSLQIVVVDENLDSLMPVKASVYQKGAGFVYVSDSVNSPSSLLRLTYTCLREDTTVKMTFTQYVDYTEVSNPQLNILGALESERVEELVRHDGFYLSLAKKKADREISELLGYDKNLVYPLESESDIGPLHFMLYLYCDVAVSDSVFYANYEKLRSALGSGIERKEILPSTSSIDSVFSMYGNYKKIKAYRFSNEQFLAVMQLWAENYGLPVCDSAAIGDTVKNENSESAYAKEQFVCFYGTDSIPMWKMVNLEEEMKDFIDSVKTDSTEGKDKKKIYSAVDELVKSQEGECTEAREKERVKIGESFFRCDSLHWEATDELTYLRGDCEKSRNGEVFHDKKYGTFMCIEQGSMGKDYVITWESVWVESTLPYYHGDKCEKAKNQNEVKFYEDKYFICDDSKWRALADSEITTPISEKDFCDSSKLHTFKTFGDSLFVCEDMQWRAPNKKELIVREAVARNEFDVHYCDQGVEGTTLFWDSTDSTLYGCGPNHLYRKADGTYGWKRVDNIVGHNATGLTFYNDDGADFAGGKFTTGSTYEVDYRGLHFTFKLGTSWEFQDELVDGILTDDNIPYVWRYMNGRAFVRDSMGHKTVRLDTLKGKSESFEEFYTKWVEHIDDNEIGTSENVAAVANFDENAHKTLQQAMDLCPEGFRLPDSTEWRTIVPKERDMESFVASSKYGVKKRYNLFWTSNEKDSETQYCYEYVLKQNERDSYYWDFVEGNIVECPKDLYPMVQAICISEED